MLSHPVCPSMTKSLFPPASVATAGGKSSMASTSAMKVLHAMGDAFVIPLRSCLFSADKNKYVGLLPSLWQKRPNISKRNYAGERWLLFDFG